MMMNMSMRMSLFGNHPQVLSAQGKDLTLFEAVPNMLALMMTSVDRVRYRKERFVGNEFIMDQTLTIIFFKITLLPSCQLGKIV